MTDKILPLKMLYAIIPKNDTIKIKSRFEKETIIDNKRILYNDDCVLNEVVDDIENIDLWINNK